MDLATYAVLNKKIDAIGNIPDEKITEAVNTYLDENPPTTGATAEQAAQINKNVADIDGLKSDLGDITITGINVFNPSKLVCYKQINNAGEIVESTTTSSVGEKIYIPSDATKIITIYQKTDGSSTVADASVIYYNFYNENGFISTINCGGSAIDIPTNATYFICQVSSSYWKRKEYLLVAFSDVQVPYESFKKSINPSLVDGLQKQINDIVGKTESFADDIAELDKEVNGVLVAGKNKFNPSNIFSFSTINNLGEVERITLNGTVSDFITIPGDANHAVWSYTSTNNVTSVLSGGDSKMAFYDFDKSLIGDIITSGESDIPDNAVYVRVYINQIYASRLAYCMLEFSDTLTSYEAYNAYYSNGLIPDMLEIKTRVSGLEKKTLIEGIVDGSIKKVKIIGDSITQGVGGTGFNPNNSTSTTYDADITAEKEAGTWSWDSETGNTYLGDGKVVFVHTTSNATKYYRKNSGICYANKLVNYLQTKYGITVENFGTRGLSFHHLFKLFGVCEDGVKRVMAEQLIEDDDDAVICMFGTNDREDSFSTLKSEIQALVDYVVKTKGKKLVLMASIPVRASGETSGSLYMEDVASCICAVAKANKVEFVSLHRDMTEYLRNTNKTINEVTADSLHPNDDGHDLMYRFVLEDLGFGSPIPEATWI